MNTILVLVFATLVLSACTADKSSRSRSTISAPTAPAEGPIPRKPSPPAPPAQPTEPNSIDTRIVCAGFSTQRAGFLSTLTTKASDSYRPAQIKVSPELGAEQEIFSQILVRSTPTIGDFYIAVEDDRTREHNIYRAQVDYFNRKTSLSLVSTVPVDSVSLLNQLRIFEPHATSIGVSRSGLFALIPDSDSNGFEIRDIDSLINLRNIPVSPAKYTNPIISPNAEWILFQRLDSNSVVRLSRYNIFYNKMIDIPSASEDFHQLSPQWADDSTLIWIEQSKAGDAKVLRIARASIEDKALISDFTLAGFGSFTAFPGNEDQITIVTTKESWEVANEGLQQYRLTKGQLQFWNLDWMKLKLVNSSEVSYPDEMLKTLFVRRLNAINNLTTASWNHELIGSLSPLSGLVSYSVKTKKWSKHSTIDGVQCDSFQVSPELKTAEEEL